MAFSLGRGPAKKGPAVKDLFGDDSSEDEGQQQPAKGQARAGAAGCLSHNLMCFQEAG